MLLSTVDLPPLVDYKLCVKDYAWIYMLLSKNQMKHFKPFLISSLKLSLKWVVKERLYKLIRAENILPSHIILSQMTLSREPHVPTPINKMEQLSINITSLLNKDSPS